MSSEADAVALSVGADAVRARLDGMAPFGRPLRAVVRHLTTGAATSIAELVALTGVPRRQVEHLLTDIGPDAETVGAGVRLRADRIDAYRGLLPSQEGRDEDDPLGRRLAEHEATVAAMQDLVDAMPRADRRLDHVSATARTAVRRALWLSAHYDLEHAHLLLVGDHDLTSLATLMVDDRVTVTVVDIDERVLEFVDRTARERGWSVRCRWADLRLGLPETAREVADLVLTDPPYTPAGVQLFLLRGLQGLRARERGRLLLAYGYAEHQPGLGLKVQEAVQGLHVVIEALLPGFNRYLGAQAIGGRSDLYVCRPTSRTWRSLPRHAEQADPRIYSQGPRSIDSGRSAVDGETVAAGVLLRESPPPGHDALVVDLTTEPESWLLRLLLAVDVEAVTVLVPNAHGDISTGAALMSLQRLMAPKYALRALRSTPDERSAVLEARAVPPIEPDSPAAREGAVAQHLLRHPRALVRTAWRDALYKVARRAGTPVGRGEVRDFVDRFAPSADALDTPLSELPRHVVVQVLDAARASAATVGST